MVMLVLERQQGAVGHLVFVDAIEADEGGFRQESTHGVRQVIGNVVTEAQLEGDRLALDRCTIANAGNAQVHQDALCHALDLVPQQALQPPLAMV